MQQAKYVKEIRTLATETAVMRTDDGRTDGRQTTDKFRCHEPC